LVGPWLGHAPLNTQETLSELPIKIEQKPDYNRSFGYLKEQLIRGSNDPVFLIFRMIFSD